VSGSTPTDYLDVTQETVVTPASGTPTPTLRRHEPTSTGEATRADIVHRYTVQGQSINEIRHAIGRSYGFVRGRLVDSGVRMRPRGGNTRKPAGHPR
jgi:hypothetical protein